MPNVPAPLVECQVCGRFQKLTAAGVVARHGFTVGGLGMGSSRSCGGSNAAPAPAVDALDRAVAHQETMRAHAAARLAEISADGYVWPERMRPVLVLRSVRDEIQSRDASIVLLRGRRASLLARVSA